MDAVTQVLKDTIKEYQDVIAKFKMRSGVLNGFDIAWKGGLEKATLANTPYGIGDGLGTTGWCVSASEALLYDDVFQLTLRYRNARAKLVSIDIKEQYYGYCYNGSQNKWHTAILVEDNGFVFIVDITCRQFGDNFIEKDIWDFETWQSTLRNANCTHKLVDFNDNILEVSPVNNFVRQSENKEYLEVKLLDRLREMTSLSDDERYSVVDFLLNRMHGINDSLILNTLSTTDYNYLNKMTRIFMKMPIIEVKNGFTVLQFKSKVAAKNWIERFLSDNQSTLPQYMLVSSTSLESCRNFNINADDLHVPNKFEAENITTYVIIEFERCLGVRSVLDNTSVIIPHGIKFAVRKGDVYNTGSIKTPPKLTNTIYIKATQEMDVEM